MIKYLIDCCIYIIFIGTTGFLVGRLLPKSWFRYDLFPFRPFRFEKGGDIYTALGVRHWKDRLPDMSVILPAIMVSKKLPKTAVEDQLVLMIRETCVAELVHGLLCIAGLHCIRLWPGAGGLLAAALNFLGNLPYIIIQRFNRPRLVRLLSAHGGIFVMRCKDYARVDTQL